jgi:methylated-DNA-[protein]-cysteine S-methyltransferase
MYASRFTTRYGYGLVYANNEAVVKVVIPQMRHVNIEESDFLPEIVPSDLTDYSAHKLQSYYRGERVCFSDIPVCFGVVSSFRRTILNNIRGIGYGEVFTYGQIASRCGLPSAVRAVGGALASNPVPVIVPCHRIVASNGKLTGFSAPGGKDTKRELLQLEGVKFKGILVVTKQLVMNRT